MKRPCKVKERESEFQSKSLAEDIIIIVILKYQSYLKFTDCKENLSKVLNKISF